MMVHFIDAYIQHRPEIVTLRITMQYSERMTLCRLNGRYFTEALLNQELHLPCTHRYIEEPDKSSQNDSSVMIAKT